MGLPPPEAASAGRSRRRVNDRASASPSRGADGRIAGESFTFQARSFENRAAGGCRYDGSHQGIPRRQPRGRTAPRRRSRRRARQLSRLRQRAAGHAGVLRGEGQSGARDPDPARRSRLVLRHGLDRRDRARARRRRDAGPGQLRQHDQEGEGHRARPCARRPPLRGRLRGGGREGGARRAGGKGVLPNPVRRRRRRMAAVAQVRLRAGDGVERARARPCARPRRARAVVPRRLAAAQPAHVGPRAEGLGGDLPRARRAGNPAFDAQPRRRLPDALSEIRAAGARLRADDLPRAAPPFRQPHPGDDHRAGQGHGRQRRDHRGGGGADLRASRRRIACAGSISTSASSTASPRRWTR